MSEPLTGEEKAEFLRRQRAERERREEEQASLAPAPPVVEEEEEEEEEPVEEPVEEAPPPGLTQEEEDEYAEARSDVVASAQARAPAPVVISDTARALDTKKREAAMPELDRQVARWRRHADADVKWPEEMQVLADRLGAPLEEFGTSHIPGNAVYAAIREAQANPEDEALRHAMMYLSNDLNITNQYPLTERNYEEKLKQLTLKDGMDLVRLEQEIQSPEDVGLTGAPKSGMTVFVRQPGGNFTSQRYESALRKLAAETEAIADKKAFRQVADDYAYLVQAPELVLEYAGNDVERTRRAIRHGELAAQAGLDASSYTPLQDMYGTAVDVDTMKLVAYLRAHRRIAEETGAEPDPVEVIAKLEPELAAFEEELRNAGLPVYDPDPAKTTEQLMEFARAMEGAAERGRRSTEEAVRYALNLPKQQVEQVTGIDVPDLPFTDFIAEEAGKAVGFGPKLASAIAQQVVPVEAKSGYVTLNGEQIRVAHDRFVESLVGRNKGSATADYILTLASGEFVAKPYVLMVNALRQKYPDEPLDGILTRHPLEARNLFYDYLGSEETLLDRAVTDSQMAEMLMTGGRVIVPSYEIAEAAAYPATLAADLMGAEEAAEAVESGASVLRGMLQVQATIGGAAAIMLAMARDPADAINVLSKGVSKLGKAVAGSKTAQRMTTASTASGDAMEISVLDGIPAAAEDMAKDEAFKEVFEGVTRDTPVRDIIRKAAAARVTVDGESIPVLGVLLDKAKENEVAHGLGAVHLAVQEEAVETVLGARVNNTVPPYGMAQAAAQIQRSTQKRLEDILEGTRKTLDEVDFNLERRQAYDQAATEHAEAAFDAGNARRQLDMYDDRLTSLKAQGMAAARVTNQSKEFVADRAKARETLLAALGRFAKAGDAAGTDHYTKLSILLAADPALEGQSIIDVVRNLKAGTPEEAAFADDVLNKFFDAYGAAGGKASDALKGAAMRRLEQEIARLTDARASAASRLDASNARVSAARKTLDDAIEGMEEISPARAERQAAVAAKRGGPGPRKIEADDGTVTYRRADPVPRKVKDASGAEKIRTDKPLREKLKADADAIEATIEAPQKAQQAALKPLAKKAKKAKPTKKTAKTLEEKAQRLDEAQERNILQGRAITRNIREMEEEFTARLLGMVDVLEARRAMKGAAARASDATRDVLAGRRSPTEAGRRVLQPVSTRPDSPAARQLDTFVDVGKVLDDYERGVYAGQSLADVLRSARLTGTPRAQAQIDELWRRISVNPNILEAGDTDAAFTSLQTYMNANRLWFDPYSAVGRLKLPFEQSLNLFQAGQIRELFQITAALFQGTLNLFSDRYGRARALRNLQQAVAPLMPTSIPRALKAIYEQQTRREAIIENDVINIGKAVEVYATKAGMTQQEALDILIKARVAYVARDLEALAGDKQGYEVLKNIFEMVGEGAARGVRTKGIAEQSGFILRQLAGGSSQPLRILNSTSSIMDDLTDHLDALRRMWTGRLNHLDAMVPTDQHVGQIIVTMVKSQIRDSADEAQTANAIRAFMRNLTALDESDVLFKGTGLQKFDRLEQLLHAKLVDTDTGEILSDDILGAVPAARVQSGREGLPGLRDKTHLLRVIDKSSAVIRSLKKIVNAQIGVTAADAAQAVRAASRGAPEGKEGARGLSAELFMLRDFEGAKGAHVYLYDELVEAHKAVGLYAPTRVQRFSPETKEFVGGRSTRRTSAVTAPTVTVEKEYGKGKTRDLVDPRFSGATRYEVVDVAEDGQVTIRNTKTGLERTVVKSELRTVPPALNAVHTIEALSRMGLPLSELRPEDLTAAAQRLCVVASANTDVPVWLMRKQLEPVYRGLQAATKTFDKTVQTKDPPVMSLGFWKGVVGSVANNLLGAVAGMILYGPQLIGAFTQPARAVRNGLEDGMSGAQVRGLTTGAALGLVALRSIGRNISEGRLLSPVLTDTPGATRLGLKAAEAIYSKVTSGHRRVQEMFGYRFPTDVQMLFDGPLQYLERADPTAVFAYGGKQLRKDGTVMTNGEVFDELVEAGVYDTFHSQARDFYITRSIENIRRGTETEYATEAAARNARIGLAIRERGEQLSAVVNDVGTEQRTWLYLDARTKGATRDEAHDILNMTLLNWTTPSVISSKLANSMVLFGRAKYQSMYQATRVWAKAAGGDTDAIRPYMQYLRLKEHVVPYVAEAYFGSEAPEGAEARAEYFATMALLRSYEAEWREPNVYLVSHPFSERERAVLRALTPGQAYVGENYYLRTRGQDAELGALFSVLDAVGDVVLGGESLGSLVPNPVALISDELNPLIKAAFGGEDIRSIPRYTRPGEEAFAMALAKIGMVTIERGEQRKLGEREGEAYKVGPGGVPIPGFGNIFYSNAYIAYSKVREMVNWLDFLTQAGTGMSPNAGIARALERIDPNMAQAYRAEQKLLNPREGVRIQDAFSKQVLADAAQGGNLDGSSRIVVEEVSKAITARLLFNAKMAGIISTDLVREDKLVYNVQQAVREVMDNAIEEFIAEPAVAEIEAGRQEALDQLDAKQ